MIPLLEVKQLVKSYNGTQILNGLSFEVYPGEIVGLLGPNGAGKTTAFYATMGLIRPEAGEVRFQNKTITSLPIHKRAQLGMGYLAQEPSIFRHLTVRDNILIVLERLNLPRAKQQERLNELLKELGLTPLAHKRAATLSGGERRRLEITRALVTKPSLLLLDEPFANIDPKAIEDVKELARHLAKRGISILITDHNAREIFSIVNRSYLVHNGQVMLSGRVDELVHSEEARTHYLGENFSL